MARRPKQRRSTTPFPDVPVQRVTGASPIDPDGPEWQLIANDVRNCIYASQNATQTLRDNWQLYNQIYELYSPQPNVPFPDASNVFLPVAVAKLDSLWAQVAAKVFVPDLHQVTGRDTQAELDSYDVQRWYNDEFRRDHQDLTTRLTESLELLFYSLLEGVSVLEVTWNHTENLEFYDVEVPKVEESDEGTFDGEDFETETQEIHKTLEIDEAMWHNVQAKDFLLVPSESKTIYESVARARCKWMYESELRAMVEEGLLSEKWVDLLMVYNPHGQSDVASDREGYWDKTAGGQIDIGQGQGPMLSPYFRNRGPFKIWVYTTDQFDFNNDKIPEKNNVIWWAELANYMLGAMPSKRISQKVNYFAYAPMPRKNSFYGFSALEREAPINAQINTIVNNLNNYVTLSMKGPMVGNAQNETHSDNYTWELGKIWWVDGDVQNSFKTLEYGDPNVVIMGLQQLQVFNSYADQLAGLSATMTGGMQTGRKSATEIKEAVAGSGTRSDLMALFLRLTLRRAFQYTHELNCQNLPEQPPEGVDQPPRNMLRQKFMLDITGTGEPIDFGTYLQEYLAFYQMMEQDPDIKGDAEKRFALKQELGQLFRIERLEAIIGTAQEATQRKQQEAQAAQMQQEMQAKMAEAEIANKLKGTPQEAQQQQQQGQPPPLDQQADVASQAADNNAEARSPNGAGATVNA